VLHAGHERRRPKIGAVETITFVYRCLDRGFVWFQVSQSDGRLGPAPCAAERGLEQGSKHKEREELRGGRSKSNNDFPRAQFVPNTPRNRGHSRPIMVSHFLCM
jgi:hypothetical protein